MVIYYGNHPGHQIICKMAIMVELYYATIRVVSLTSGSRHCTSYQPWSVDSLLCILLHFYELINVVWDNICGEITGFTMCSIGKSLIALKSGGFVIGQLFYWIMRWILSKLTFIRNYWNVQILTCWLQILILDTCQLQFMAVSIFRSLNKRRQV